VQTGLFPTLPNFEIPLFRFSQSVFQKFAERDHLIEVECLLKVLFAFGDHFFGDCSSEVSKAVELVGLEDEDGVISPQSILQQFIYNYLIN